MSKIGPHQGTQAPFELDIYDHIQPINPADFGIKGKLFDPKQYFITSGDAVSKTNFLIRELAAYVASIPEGGPWKAAATSSLAGARLMLEYLVKARGPQIFLETEWNDRRLLVIPKDPRKREVV